MKKEKNLITRFYYPYCREKGCCGILKIKFGDNFNIDYECDKNKEHKGKEIFFKTFERFYLKEKEIEKCINCFSVLDYDVFYKCKQCDKLYCTMCFIKDEHIKKDINNLEIITKKCSIHKRELNQYCIDCKKNFCVYCLKNDDTIVSEDSHKGEHKVINLTDYMPTKEQIINLKNKIKEKNKFYEEIINSINKWEKTLITKTNRIKQNLKDEISLFSKIVYNYNQYFLNYTYYSTFYFLDEYFKNKNCVMLNKFKNTVSFEEKNKVLFEYFNLNKNNKKTKKNHKKGYFEHFYSLNNGLIEKINNEYYFEYFSENEKIYLSKYDKKSDNIKYSEEKEFKDKIYSVSISKENSQIYICLLDKKEVKILDYNLDKKEFKLNKNSIIDENNIVSHFNKCIKLTNDFFATIDNDMIIIWDKTNDDSNRYNIVKRNYMFENTTDILLANEDYFISSQSKNQTLIIYDIKSLSIEHYITNIDCIDSTNCFLLFKQYVIINCKKGIALFFIKTKEITQYIENYIGFSENKEIILDNNEHICILNKTMKTNMLLFNIGCDLKIIKLNMVDGLFEPYEEYEKIELKEKDIIRIICLNDGDFILLGKNVYVLKEEEENNIN